MNTTKNRRWFEKTWLILSLGGLFLLGMVSLNLFLYHTYNDGFLKEYVLKHGESDGFFLLLVNFFFGLCATSGLLAFIMFFIDVTTNKWKKNQENLQALIFAALFVLLYPVHLRLQFIMISKHIYQYNALFNAEIILLLGIGIVFSICAMVIFNIPWIKIPAPINEVEKEVGVETVGNEQLKEFLQSSSLKEKRSLLHTYMDELSKKEIDTLNQMENDLNMLYEKYQLLRSPQKEMAYQRITEVISHQEKELEQMIENIHNKHLASIERKADRILNKK